MATYQTTYSDTPAKGFPGQIANEEKHNQISRTPTTDIPFGAPAFRVPGAGNDHKCAATGADFLGLAVLTPAIGVRLSDGFASGYAANVNGGAAITASLMTDGQMFVTAGGPVAPGDAVTYNAGTNRYTADGGTAIPGAFFDTTGADGDIVEVSLKHRSA